MDKVTLIPYEKIYEDFVENGKMKSKFRKTGTLIL